jgi:hypothetical protein
VRRAVPREQVLLESDLEEAGAVGEGVWAVCGALGEALGLDRAAVINLTRRNAAAFLRKAL